MIFWIPCIALSEFQFTHPGRGATNRDNLNKSTSRVSIHAPREGCDFERKSFAFHYNKFQFTHPGRGATKPCESSL